MKALRQEDNPLPIPHRERRVCALTSQGNPRGQASHRPQVAERVRDLLGAQTPGAGAPPPQLPRPSPVPAGLPPPEECHPARASEPGLSTSV